MSTPETPKKLIEPLLVNNFLLCHEEELPEGKRIRRKLKRLKAQLQTKVYKNMNQCIEILSDFLKQTRDKPVGFICDKLNVHAEQTYLPPPPLTWDILCLQSEIQQYKYNNENNNIYWCATLIEDTYNFVVNPKSIGKVIKLLKSCDTWSDVMDKFNKELLVFSNTQFKFSSRMFNKPSKNMLPVTNLVNTFDKRGKDELLPNVSIICILTNPKFFFQALYTFLTVDYPKDKLELIIVDDQDSEKQLKVYLPNDSRIRVVNITQKDKKGTLPLGYKLNAGVQYAKNDVIYHMIDISVYMGKEFKNLMKIFLMSNVDCVMSYDTAYYHSNTTVSDSDISNMVYIKNFWKARPFGELESNGDTLIKGFLESRSRCTAYVPFVYFSARMDSNDKGRILPFKIQEIFSSKQQESIKIAFGL
jgi:hypothetical protein